MIFFIGSAIAAFLVTTLAARTIVLRWPGVSLSTQVIWSALSFPILALALFALATVWTLVQSRQLTEPGGSTGMVVFAMVFFLLYAAVIGAVVGIPTAIAMVRMFRQS
ncbi:hypothetical protein [Allosphingosinicella deserti]|uniref:Transporter n=1 Tax=Allosphingosinicella deserti TaxID=2116704 RepID=A0A2P7QKQ6_9SPHN|nr:hypothetical protein [Sphingomonas deserti]PSJ38520.1 hypothetical protein C7I55_19020 [Sphingomonas deserti]